MVTHDINLAARYADHLVAMAVGAPAEVLSTNNVRAVFGLDYQVMADPISGKLLVLPIG